MGVDQLAGWGALLLGVVLVSICRALCGFVFTFIFM